jgi:glutamate synthase (ferredoxin)
MRNFHLQTGDIGISQNGAFDTGGLRGDLAEGQARRRVDRPEPQGLYLPHLERDACGTGFVVNVKGKKSHEIVEQALTVLLNLAHRGARGAEPNTGDGAGILLQMPHTFMQRVAGQVGIQLPAPRQYGVGMVFLPPDPEQRRHCQQGLEQIVRAEGQHVLGWRQVPTDNRLLGQSSRASEPFVSQIFIGRSHHINDDLAFERKLYLIRQQAEKAIRYGDVPGGHYFYIVSLSYKTIVYKGMLTAEQLPSFYPDLSHPSLETALALVHSRFSTNTFPSWERAHPYRYLIHNGEINTLRGNINWMRAREALFESAYFGHELAKALPVIDSDGSDTAMFDNCLEFLVLNGRSLPHAVMMMIPDRTELSVCRAATANRTVMTPALSRTSLTVNSQIEIITISSATSIVSSCPKR